MRQQGTLPINDDHEFFLWQRHQRGFSSLHSRGRKAWTKRIAEDGDNYYFFRLRASDDITAHFSKRSRRWKCSAAWICRSHLELDHLTLALLVTTQLEMLRALDGHLQTPFALSAFETEHELLRGLCLKTWIHFSSDEKAYNKRIATLPFYAK